MDNRELDLVVPEARTRPSQADGDGVDVEDEDESEMPYISLE